MPALPADPGKPKGGEHEVRPHPSPPPRPVRALAARADNLAEAIDALATRGREPTPQTAPVTGYRTPPSSPDHSWLDPTSSHREKLERATPTIRHNRFTPKAFAWSATNGKRFTRFRRCGCGDVAGRGGRPGHRDHHRAGQLAGAAVGTGLPNIVQVTAIWSAWAALAIFGSVSNSAHISVEMRRVAERVPVRSVELVAT